MIDLKKLYDSRFTTFERVRKERLWRILCHDFLQQFVAPNDLVVDVGAGQCEFINNISCGRKVALDINLDTKKFAHKDVRVITASVKRLKNKFKDNSVDTIFMSNLLEHLDNKEEVFRLLNEAYQVLKKGGKLLIMQPDISLVGHAYWDFFDHKVPITCASLLEVLKADNFAIKYLLYPFLPYSTKVGFLPLNPIFLKMYLKIRPLHYLFGKQFFVCAEK